MVKVKQVIIARKDLKMPPGKLAAQVAHASLAPILAMGTFTPSGQHAPTFTLQWNGASALHQWIYPTTPFTKVVLRVDSEEEYHDMVDKLTMAGKRPSCIRDAGHTVFDKPTDTCIGLPPMFEDEIDPLTGHLSLY